MNYGKKITQALLLLGCVLVSTLRPCPISRMVFSGPDGSHVEIYGDWHNKHLDDKHPELIAATRAHFLELAAKNKATFLFESLVGTAWPYWATFINDMSEELAKDFPQQFVNIDSTRKHIIDRVLANDPAGLETFARIARGDTDSELRQTLDALRPKKVINKGRIPLWHSNEHLGATAYPLLKLMYKKTTREMQQALNCMQHQELRDAHTFADTDKLKCCKFDTSPYGALNSAMYSMMETATLLEIVKQLSFAPKPGMLRSALNYAKKIAGHQAPTKHIVVYVGEVHAVVLGGMLTLLGFTLQESIELVPQVCENNRKNFGPTLLAGFGLNHPGNGDPAWQSACTPETVAAWQKYWATKASMVEKEPCNCKHCGIKRSFSCSCYAR